MQLQHQKGRAGRGPIAATFRQVGDKVIASAPWPEPDDPHAERFMVFTVRDGKIVDMAGFLSRREAERFANRR